MLGKTLTYYYDLGVNPTAVKEYALTTADVLPTQPQKTEIGTYSAAWEGSAPVLGRHGHDLRCYWKYADQGNNLLYLDPGKEALRRRKWREHPVFYEHTGERTKKVVDGVATEYRMSGNFLASERIGTQTYWYRCDFGANLVSVIIDGNIYFYVRNVQNDVTALIDAEGNTVVK